MIATKTIIYCVLILGLVVSHPTSGNRIASDHFRGNSWISNNEELANDSIWTKEPSDYMDIQETDGILTGKYLGSNTTTDVWRKGILHKDIEGFEGFKIDADIEFNFAKMGEIILYAYDDNGTTPRWAIGYSDAWISGNGVAFAHSYTADGLFPESYPVNDVQREWEKIPESAGSGHISVTYTAALSINVTITLPQRRLSLELPLSGPVDVLRLIMSAAEIYNTVDDVWVVFNYKESGFEDAISSSELGIISSLTHSTDEINRDNSSNTKSSVGPLLLYFPSTLVSLFFSISFLLTINRKRVKN